MPDLHPPGRLLPQSPRRVFVWGSEMTAHWIKVEKSTPAKPEVMQLAAILGIDEFTVVGHLVAFWSWADSNLSPECPAAHGTIRGLDRVAGRDGFCAAMIMVGWLQHHDGQFSVPKLDRHMGKSAKTRAEDTEKKRKQRLSQKCPETHGTNVPDDEGQKQGPEKRREEIKTHTHGKPEQNAEQGQPFIPDKMNTPECLSAFENWCDYLTVAGLDTINPRLNGIQAQAVWQQASRIGPDRWPDAVSHSIANGYKSIINRTEAPGRKAGKDKPKGPTLEFLRAVNVCREYPSASDYDREKRETLLGPDLMRTVRKMGTPRLAECDRYTQSALAAEWEILRESTQ
jgi:hypothetical protein